ncbi:MAG: hypothetical protein U1A27_05295 [Phycisphaerae bacterium]
MRAICPGIAFLTVAALAWGDEAAAPRAQGVATPQTLATYSVSGYYGLRTEKTPRSLAGTIRVACAKDGDLTRIVTVYDCQQPGVTIGCPISFFRKNENTEPAREPGLGSAYACTFVNHVLWPAHVRGGKEPPAELLAQVIAIDTPMSANLKVQTGPRPKGGGWRWSESLARFSDEQMLPPGRSRLTEWTGAYEYDAEGLLESADQSYALQVSQQGNMEIVVKVTLKRTELRPFSASEAARFSADAAAGQELAKIWHQKRNQGIALLEKLQHESPAGIYGPMLASMRKQAEAERERFKAAQPAPGGGPSSAPAGK